MLWASNIVEVDAENREIMPFLLDNRAEMECSLSLNFHQIPQYILPMRTVIYIPTISFWSFSRQIQINSVSSDEVSDDDEGPPDLIGDSDDDYSDSVLSCNMTITSMDSSDGSVGNFYDDDDAITDFEPTMS